MAARARQENRWNPHLLERKSIRNNLSNRTGTVLFGRAGDYTLGGNPGLLGWMKKQVVSFRTEFFEQS
jgi:hypothetical protein